MIATVTAYFKLGLCTFLMLFIGYSSAFADKNGITGRTTTGCGGNGCHDQNTATSINISGLTSNTIYMTPSSTRSFSAIVAHSSQVRAGINIGFKNSSDQSVGTLTAGTGLKKPGAAELTHNGSQVMTGGQFSFNFTLQAPSTTGTYYLRAAGNAVNYDNDPGGDSWSFMTQVTIIVANPTVALVAPNGGEVACRGAQINISWTPINLSANVKLEYTTNGSTWTTIATVPTSPAFYIWTIPAAIPIGATYKIRVSDATTSSINDVSDNNFTINTVPTILTHPKSDSVCVGGSVTMSVTTDNPTSYTYQWRRNAQNINGSTSSTYTISNAQIGQEGDYDVVVKGCSPVTSNAGLFIISSPPSITQQPSDTTVCIGTSATFRSTSTGSILTYQWKKNGTNIIGATNSVLNIASVSGADTGNYSVTVSGKCSPPQTSNAAFLRFTPPPTITVQPRDTIECLNETATFSVEATGLGLTYQWRKNGKNIENAQGANYVVNGVTASDAANYDVVVTNSCNLSTTTKAALLKITSSAIITSQPRDTSIQTNLNATFSVTATGDNIRYQWMKNNSIRPADTFSILSIKNVKLSDSGSYKCLVENKCGQVESTPAKLTITAPPAGAALALSVSSIDFSCIKVKSTKDTIIANVIFNGGGLPLNVTNVAVTGLDAGDFMILTGGGTFTLSPNEKRTLALRFTPSTKTVKSATLEFTSNTTTTSPRIVMSGAGCLGKIDNNVLFKIDSVLVTTKRDTVLKICNSGDYPILITSSTLTGLNSSSFTTNLSVLINKTLKPLDCLNLPISFTPTVEGRATADLELLIDGQSIKLPIEGIGIIPVGIDDEVNNSTDVRVYPNPSSGNIILSGRVSYPLPISVRIFDGLGKQVFQDILSISSAGEFQITLNQVANRFLQTSGNYNAVLNFGISQITVPFVIIR